MVFNCGAAAVTSMRSETPPISSTQIQFGPLIDVQLDAGAADRLEARVLDRNAVLAGQEQGRRVVALFVGYDFSFGAHLGVCNGDECSGDDRPGAVGNTAGDARGLGKRTEGGENETNQ